MRRPGIVLNQEMVKRLIMMTIGCVFMGIAITIYNKVQFGTDPFTSMVLGIAKHLPVSFGVTQLTVNVIIIAIAFKFSRNLIGIGTFINVTCIGFIVDFATWLYQFAFPDPEVLWVKSLLFLCAVIIHCFGGSIFFTAALGVGAYDVVAFVMNARTKINYRWCRMGTDFFCTAAGFLLGATIGIGTVVTAFFMGPVIQWFTDHFSLPFLYGKEAAAEKILEEKLAREQKKEEQARKREEKKQAKKPV